MASDSTEVLVDETPLSPIERQESLEKHLQMRPDAQDLKNRNILHDTNAAPYAITSSFNLQAQVLIITCLELSKQRDPSWNVNKQPTTSRKDSRNAQRRMSSSSVISCPIPRLHLHYKRNKRNLRST